MLNKFIGRSDTFNCSIEVLTVSPRARTTQLRSEGKEINRPETPQLLDI